MLVVNRWNELYENARTREYKTLRFLLIPNDYDSEGALDLIDLPEGDGLEIFGIFILLLEFTSKRPRPERGIICTDDVQDVDRFLSRKLRISQEKIKRTLDVLVNEPFKWLTSTPCTGDGQLASMNCRDSASDLNRLDLIRIEENALSNEPGSKIKIVKDILLAYPKQCNGVDAERACVRALKKVDAKTLMATVKAFAIAIAWQEMAFIPDPATWFDKERWKDDPKTWEEPKKSSKGKQGKDKIDDADNPDAYREAV